MSCWSEIGPLLSIRRDLKSERADVRREAVRRGRELHGSGAIKTLILAMGDADGEVREAAVFALAESRSAHAPKLLRDAVADKRSPKIRIGAANALGVRGSSLEGERAAAFDAIRKRIDFEQASVATYMAMALRNTADPRVPDALISMVKSKTGNLVPAAIPALMMFQEARVFEALAEALRQHDLVSVMRDAALALAAYDDPRAVGFILERVRTLQFATFFDDEGNQFSCKEPFFEMMPHFQKALAAIKAPEKVDILIRHLSDPHQHVAIMAGFALGDCTGPRARAALESLLGHRDPALQEVGKTGLKNF